jgi:GntR family transcriptional repressor for pyruvate dehydrogenase complex
VASRKRPTERMRTPRLAEMVSAQLRERIVDGELADGELLPPLDRLVEEFGVSPPSIREALRILENERLITVRRGNVGGAVVHRPKANAAAYMLGLVLQSEHVPMSDLALALVQLEPLCARLDAERKDRKRTVVPRLRNACKQAEDNLDEAVLVEHWSRQFHNDLIEHCGNETLVLVVGTLERLWASQQEAWTYRVTHLDESPDLELRKQGLAAHWEILDAIEAGDGELAERRAREHMEHPDIFGSRQQDRTIRATDAPMQAELG